MILQSAFFTLPEILTSDFAHSDVFEATLVNNFVTASLMQFYARNIANPYQYISREKPYDGRVPRNRPLRADIFVNLERAVRQDPRSQAYGVRHRAWIEVKGSFSTSRGKQLTRKIEAAGRILRDIVRLCVFPDEPQGSNRINSRYLLLAFAHPPEALFATRKQSRFCDGACSLFRAGPASLEVDLADEPPELRHQIGHGFGRGRNLKVTVSTETYSFAPVGSPPTPIYHGFLVRIREFSITANNHTFELRDDPKQRLSSADCDQLQLIRDFYYEQSDGGSRYPSPLPTRNHE